ncbi:response regulator [Macrococcus bovicus]|uniref:Response regulator n=1 Tax=Macrococcus bovicus TaxID=69968 RepID=A0A4R6C2L4_9STAP|nr:response regulator [Macrococcus bovicus]TDM15508.1 response regulator [Macrococcus bovicus]WJP96899.1 response regulator [Macrococcus bovicus]
MAIRVAIIEDSQELAAGIHRYLSSQGMMVTDIANDGQRGQELIQRGNFDVLLLDLILPNIDGLTLLKNDIPADRPYKVICFSAFGKESILHEALTLGGDYFLLKPVKLEVIAQTILRMTEQKDSDLLNDYFAQRLKGTQYIYEALNILEQHPAKINHLTGELYPEIARKFDVNKATIERAIRHAIEKAWRNGLEQHWQAEGKMVRPTTGELLEYLMR